MAENRETLRAMAQIRIRVAATVDAVTDDLVRSWLYSWNQIVPEWEAAVAELAALRRDGRWPTASQINRAERAQRALQATYAGLIALGEQAGITITRGVNDVIQAASGQVDVIATQLPPGNARLGVSLVRADPRQIEQIIIRTQTQVTKDLFPLGIDSYNLIRSNLIKGVALGDNPRLVARRMVRGIEIGYNRALSRALVIARTEMLSAHRAAAQAHELANADTLKGWRWLTALDARTCPACVSMYGREFGINEPGPQGHQNCRCARQPITKTWKELGFDIPEPAPLVTDPEQWFDGLPEDKQRGLLGPKRFEAWKSGDYPMSRWAVRRENPGWRDSYVVSKVPA